MPLLHGRVPEAGEVFWIDLAEAVGHEQGGRRPHLVVSPVAYNRVSSLVLVCPITRSSRPWAFKVPLSPVGSIAGFVLVDQVRSVDMLARPSRYAGRVSDANRDEVIEVLLALLGGAGA